MPILERGSKGPYPTIVLVFVVLLAAWMSDASGGYFVGNWALPAFVLAALALLASATGLFGNTNLRWGVLALGLFAAYAAWTSASLLWSPNKGDAWLGLGQTLLYAVAFMVSVSFVAMGASRRWALATSALGSAAIAAFTLQALVPRFEALFDDHRLVGTVGYYNGEAAFLLIAFWVAVYLGGSPRVNPLVRGLVLAGAVLSLDLAVLTQSRGAMVAMVASAPIYFLLSGQRLRGLASLAAIGAALAVALPGLNGVYLASLNGEDATIALELVLPIVWMTAAIVGLYGLCWGLLDRKFRLPDNVVRVAGAFVLAGCAVVFAIGAITVSERGDPVDLAQQKWEAFKTDDTAGQEQSRYLSVSGTGRYTLWRVAWENFSSHPLLGVGTQNYEATYYQLREQVTGFARQPHSLPLEVLSERGVVGGVLFFGFLSVCLIAGLWERFRNLRSEGKAQVGALMAAVTYWFVHSSAEWFWQMPAITLIAMIYLAMLVSPWRVDATPESLRWPLRAVGIGVAVLALLIIAPLYLAERNLAQSYATTDPATALAAVERAQGYNPLDPRLPKREAELATRAGKTGRAEDAYKQAIQLNPRHYAPYASLAGFYQEDGRSREASKYYHKALTLNPLDQELRQKVDRRTLEFVE